jgi:LysM repeat protein
MLKHILFITSLILSLPAVAQNTTRDERVKAYVQQYREWAQAEQHRSGVPAAITLAQGIFETDAGGSELATQAKNHFGIKCKKEWTGATFAHDDDAPQECFRKYNTALESYRDHSDYLRTSKRYASCFALQATDYAGWARELRRCGYATNPIYAQKLIKIIEDYNLQDYTVAALKSAPKTPVMVASAASPVAAALMAEGKKPGEVVPDRDTPTEQPEYGRIIRKNGMKGFWARSGDVLLEYAIQYKVRYAKLLEINGLPDAPLAKDQFIYLEKGSTVERIMSKDVSTPTPVQAIAAPPAAAPDLAAVTNEPVAPTTPTVASAPVATETSTPQLVASTTAVPAPAAKEVSPSAAEVTPTPAQPKAIQESPAPAVKAKSAESEFNIANEKAVEEQKPAPEPQDEFGRMKARFDKVVYAPAPVKQAPAATTVSETPMPAVTIEKPVTAAAGPTYHTVKTGETAFSIAKHYGITMQNLMDMNKLSFGTSIKVGQKLRVK